MKRGSVYARSCIVMASTGLAVVLAVGCGTTDGFRTTADAREVKVAALPPLPAGATPRTISIEPFTMSRLITVAPEISLSSAELCAVVTERAQREFVGSPQFRVVAAGQPADYVLRGEIAELMIGPETKVSTFGRLFGGASGGSGSETSQVRPLDMVVEAELVDVRSNSAVIRGIGASKRDIHLSQTVTASGSYQTTNGEGSTSMEGYKFDQQHLQEVIRTAANQLVLDVSRKANERIFTPEAMARKPASGAASAGAFTP
ncbi:MAG: hypothetical protein IT436_08680 [Phycisphaerales bacterium]|nr:hypothetical protein [Phycisphaerales bacterium]